MSSSSLGGPALDSKITSIPSWPPLLTTPFPTVLSQIQKESIYTNQFKLISNWWVELLPTPAVTLTWWRQQCLCITSQNVWVRSPTGVCFAKPEAATAVHVAPWRL